MSIKEYIETATFIEDNQLVSQLEALEQQMEDKVFYLPFVGQFSAGKTKLINLILGQNVLPVKVTESTAFITYIRYAEQPKAILVYKDGSSTDVAIEMLKEIHQVGIDEGRFVDNPIEYISVELPHPLLKGGIQIVDTPGVNTMVEEHEALTYHLLENANYMIYVIAKPLTTFDQQLIRQFQEIGITPIFVRTRIDLFSQTEENIQEALDKERKMVEECFGEDTMFFPLSNQYMEYLPEVMEPYFKRFENYLYNELLKERLVYKETAEQNKLKALAQKLKNKLIDKKKQVEILSKKDLQTIQHTLETLNNKIYALELEKQRIENKCEHSFAKAQNDIKNQIVRQSDDSVYEFNKYIIKQMEVKGIDNITYETDAIEYLNSFMNQIKEHTNKLIQQTIQDTDQVYQEYLNIMNREITNSYKSEFEVVLSEFDEEEYFDEKIHRMNKYQQDLMELKELIKNQEEKIEIGKINQPLLEGSLKEYECAVREAYNELKEVENIEIPLIEKEGDTTNSDTLGRIGELIDWGLLLIPATSILKGSAQVLGKGAKIAKEGGKIHKALKAGEKAAKSKKMVDKAKKADKVIKGYQNIKSVAEEVGLQAYEKTENKGILKALDYLSVEFYCRELGKKMDTPSTYHVDQEAKQFYEEQKRHLETKYNAATKEKLRKLEQLNLIKSQEDKILREKEMNEQNVVELEKDLKLLITRIEKERKQKIKESRVTAIKNSYQEAIEGIKNQLINTIFDRWDHLKENYKEQRMHVVLQQLELLKVELENAVSQECNYKELQDNIQKYIESI